MSVYVSVCDVTGQERFKAKNEALIICFTEL